MNDLGRKPAIRVVADPASAIIRVHGTGFWAPDEIDLMLDRLADQVAQARSIHGSARVLVDLSSNGAQMADTVTRIAKRSSAIYREGDRLAVVLESSILKMQIGRIERASEFHSFTNLADAEAWLASPATPSSK